MITDTFDSISQAIINPEDFTGGRKDLPEKILMTFSGMFTKRLQALYDIEETAKVYTGHGIPVYTFTFHDEEIGYIQSDIGGPAATAILETLYARGASKVLAFGSCGSLTRELNPAHMIIPSKAYRDEGTSYHYLPTSDYAENPYAHKTELIMNTLGISHLKAPIWTTDALYRETKENARKRKLEGCMAVDMECASLLACSQYRKKEFHEFLFTADCLDGNYDIGILSHTSKDTVEQIIQSAVEIISKI